MKNIFDVLKQKEAELQQIQKEIEALRVAARIMQEDGEPRGDAGGRQAAAPPAPAPTRQFP